MRSIKVFHKLLSLSATMILNIYALCICISLESPGFHLLTVYDCSSPTAQFEAIDLNEPHHCPDPVHDYDEPQEVTVQILQTDTSYPVTGFRCDVVMSRQVTRCGYDSITYGTHWPVWEQAVEMTPEECRRAVKDKTIKIDGRMLQIDLGQPTQAQYFTQGHLSTDGECEYNSFTTNGIHFSKSYELTQVTVMVTEIRGTLDVSTGHVKFSNGLAVNYQDQIIRDAVEGIIIWTATKPSCNSLLSEVYLGKSRLHRKKSNKDLAESIIMIESNRTGQFAGLQLRKPQSVCDVHCHSTQINGVIACLLRDMDSPLPRFTFQSHFDPTSANLQTQLAHLHLSTNANVQEI